MNKILIKIGYLLAGVAIGYIIWEMLLNGIGQSLFYEGYWGK